MNTRPVPTGHRHHKDRGAVQAPIGLAGGIGAFLVLVLLVAAGLLATEPDPSACTGQATAAQPGVAPEAESAIPATYLRLYQQAGQQYKIPWNLLAAIGKIESDHGRDPSSGVRSGANYAGAAGPMQIGVGGAAGNNWGGTPRHPATLKTGGVGVDGNHDGWADVHDPADAIPAAARYLTQHGAPGHLEKAVFAYNPSAGYVRAVLAQAARYAQDGAIPTADAGADLGTCPGDTTAYAPMPGPAAAKVIAYARAQLGKPYVYGAEGPDSFDCSGLTMRAYQAAGIQIPRTADVQYHQTPKILKGSEQPGDLVFFNYHAGMSGPGHVGIVIGSGRMIEARCTRCGPITINPYTNRNPVGFTRPHPNKN